MDFKDIKNATDIVEVISGYVSLKKHGHEHVGVCPFHDDHSASLQVNENKQIFKCFACGEGGDAIDFLLSMGKTHKEAVAELTGGVNTNGAPKHNKAKAAAAPKWEQLPTADFACPSEMMQQKSKEIDGQWVAMKYIAHWQYTDAHGNLVGYTVRFEDLNGEKDVYPLTFRTDGTRKAWRWLGFDKYRPLYNLRAIEANPNAIIIMAEGEKTADAAQAHFDSAKAVVTTWIGGANAIAKADFSPIKGRKAYLMPDNDVEGLSAMLHIRNIAGLGASKIVPLDTTLPKGWDVADRHWNDGELRGFVNARAVTDIPANTGENMWSFKQIGRDSIYEFGLQSGSWFFRKVAETPPVNTPPLPTNPHDQEGDYYANELPPSENVDRGGHENGAWFRFMGYEKNDSGTQKFHFYVFRSNQLVSLSPSAMTKSNLLLLAPLNWWEETFPAQKAKFDADGASNWLIEMSIKVGIFNADFVRGRGAWMDGKDVVIHCGSHLIVNGQTMAFNHYKTKYIYEAGFELGFEPVAPISNIDGKKLLDLCSLVNWERPINAYFLAGWCVIAPICGALKWRPHIWITGAAGTGKSWIFEKIVKRMLAQTAVAVQSETTEAGIRQYLGQDALPVLFDEAEGEDRRAQERMQSVLTLMRGASTSDGGMIIKGSAGGSATRYRIRSCFAYASIGIALTQQSDRSRVTVLGVQKLQGEEGADRWKKIQRAYSETVKDEYVASLQSRTVAMLPVILKNAETFSSAAAAVLGDQRSGDQVGALLAGAYSLISHKAINFDEAMAWIQSKDWSEEKANDSVKDEVRLITHLMETLEKVEVVEIGGSVRYFERTVGDLVNIAHAPSFFDDEISRDTARKNLNRLGYKVSGDSLLVSNTAASIKRALKDTPWANNHMTILKRLTGAQSKDGTTFGSGIKSRAVEIPLTTIFVE